MSDRIEADPQTGSGLRRQRSLSLAGAVVLGLTLFGYLVGILGGNAATPPRPPDLRRPVADGSAPPAVTYSDLSSVPLRRNRNAGDDIRDLKFDRPSRLETVTRTAEMTALALSERAKTRAFEGAPPIIPHAIDQQAAGSCLVCHEKGVKLGDRIAPRISHEHFTSCTQCHVESVSRAPSHGATLVFENQFLGVARSGPGVRAWSGAPPAIPHTTFLREDCMSCHGTLAKPGLRTTHPWFNNCEQCHASSARLDQVRFRTSLRD